MAGEIGITNGNSRHMQQERELRSQLNALPRVIDMRVTLADLENLAIKIAGRHQLALYHGNEARLNEYERQMTLLAEYAQEMAEVGL
jgi:hypothetical protein